MSSSETKYTMDYYVGKARELAARGLSLPSLLKIWLVS